jgi:hypothetical protein
MTSDFMYLVRAFEYLYVATWFIHISIVLGTDCDDIKETFSSMFALTISSIKIGVHDGHTGIIFLGLRSKGPSANPEKKNILIHWLIDWLTKEGGMDLQHIGAVGLKEQ